MLREGAVRGLPPRPSGAEGRPLSRTRRSRRLHDWRKRVKDLWYHQPRLLRDLWSPVLSRRRPPRTKKRLSEDLGDDHDLAMLAARVTATGGAGSAEGGDDDVLELVAHRRHDLQEGARRLGARLYAEKPAAFRRRLARYLAAVQEERRGPQVA